MPAAASVPPLLAAGTTSRGVDVLAGALEDQRDEGDTVTDDAQHQARRARRRRPEPKTISREVKGTGSGHQWVTLPS